MIKISYKASSSCVASLAVIIIMAWAVRSANYVVSASKDVATFKQVICSAKSISKYAATWTNAATRMSSLSA
jgi:hypothetical protein